MSINSPFTGERADAIAATLFEDHRARRPFKPFAVSAGIRTQGDAYSVQDRYVGLQMDEREASVAGYKIGLTSKQMQEMCKIDSPAYGIVLADRVKTSGVALAASDYGRIGLEFEIAVRIGTVLVPHGEPFTPQEVADAVDGVAPAIELVDDRHCVYAELDVLSLIADNAWNAGIVHAPFLPFKGDLAPLRGAVTIGGLEVGHGFGRDALGHPVLALTWLANELRQEGISLDEGQIVMTGSIVKTVFPTQTTAFRFAVESLGAVDCTVQCA